MQEKRVYDPRIADLELKVSYGSLGPIETIVLHSNDPPHLKRNVLIINGDTIIRNCYEGEVNNDLLKKVDLDIEKLIYFFNNSINGESYIFIYFHPDIHHYIPEHLRKTQTKTREDIAKMSLRISLLNSFQPNKFKRIDHGSTSKIYGMMIQKSFAYRLVPKAIREILPNAKSWMITHCPIDYLMTEQLDVNLVMSHTGIILLKDLFGKKVFGIEDVPFNRTTYKLFGDKEFIRPIIRNKTKALDLLKGKNLKLLTEREIYLLALSKLNINKQLLNWNF